MLTTASAAAQPVAVSSAARCARRGPTAAEATVRAAGGSWVTQRWTAHAVTGSRAATPSEPSTGCPPRTPTARTAAYSRRGASQRWERASTAVW
ncbi:hypothetical protein GCM10010504_20790 [Streptomyces griseus]|nr:hypothetical protein GCM10010504_20790 [Streptomyces griseus]